MIGGDEAGSRVLQLFQTLGVDTSGVVRVAARPTTQKMRIVAHNQQVVRADRESTTTLDGRVEQALCRLYLDGVLSYDEAMTAADSPTNLAWLVNQNSPTTSVDPATVHEEAERRIAGDFVKLEIDPEFLNRP